MSGIVSYMGTYNNFRTPSFEVTIDGTVLNTTFGISNLSVDLGIGETANGCRFTLANVFSHKTHSITNEAKNKIILGKIVKVSLGYSSNLQPVFTGYIEGVNYSYDASGAPAINVTCLDGRALMRMSAQRKVSLDKNIEDIVNEIFADYKPLIKSVNASLDTVEVDKKLQMDKNDLDFILWLANSRNRYFYVLDDVAYIAKKESASIFVYDFNNTLFSLDFSMQYLDITYEAIANEKKGDPPFTVKATAAQPGVQESPISKKLTEIYKIKESSQADAEKRNKAKADKAKRDCQSGSITSVGLPELFPGKNIKIDNFPVESMSKQNTFCITSVNHSIDTGGFTTTVSFSLGV